MLRAEVERERAYKSLRRVDLCTLGYVLVEVARESGLVKLPRGFSAK